MIHQLHKLEFSICSLGMCHILEWSAEFLDGHVLLLDCVVRSTATHTEKALDPPNARMDPSLRQVEPQGKVARKVKAHKSETHSHFQSIQKCILSHSCNLNF